MDFTYLAITAAMVALVIGLAVGCDRLGGGR
jgi:hypothetical protein